MFLSLTNESLHHSEENLKLKISFLNTFFSHRVKASGLLWVWIVNMSENRWEEGLLPWKLWDFANYFPVTSSCCLDFATLVAMAET